MGYRDLDPDAACRELERDPALRVLDVRTPAEHGRHRLPNAVLVPIQELQERVGELDHDARWLVVCEHGVRSQHACDFLLHLGFTDVANLRGGVAHWAARGLPLER